MQNPFESLFDKLLEIESKLNDLDHSIQRSESKNGLQAKRLDRQELSKKYCISLSTIHKLMRNGVLPYEKIGRKTLFKYEDVENCFSKVCGNNRAI